MMEEQGERKLRDALFPKKIVSDGESRQNLLDNPIDKNIDKTPETTIRPKKQKTAEKETTRNSTKQPRPTTIDTNKTNPTPHQSNYTHENQTQIPPTTLLPTTHPPPPPPSPPNPHKIRHLHLQSIHNQGTLQITPCNRCFKTFRQCVKLKNNKCTWCIHTKKSCQGTIKLGTWIEIGNRWVSPGKPITNCFFRFGKIKRISKLLSIVLKLG